MDKIGLAGKPSNGSQGEETKESGVVVVEKNSSSSDEKIEPAVSIVQKIDEPGKWQSKIGISIPKSGKWNPFFRLPTIGASGSVVWKLAKFYGPGAIVSVAYVDPDNYQTDISVGAQFQYKLLFMVLLSNILAVYLQVLSAKIGAITGLTLAEMNRFYLPRWLNIGLWLIAEATIICTDVGQVIGTAIAINLLNSKIPLLAGCALSVLDALTILLVYNPSARLYFIRPFEIFIGAIVATIFFLFVVELTKVEAPAGEVFKGYLPSREIFVGQGLFQSSAIVGGNLMPHSLYVGSSIVHARLREFDIKEELYQANDGDSMASVMWRPSYRAIKATLNYTFAELCITVFIIAMFVNSAVLIVAAAAFPESAGDADLFGMYALFQTSLGQSAATIFAIGLLFSGSSAGIVATMAGQIVMEGAFNIRISPFVRRLVTRMIAIIPAMVIAAAVGQQGLGTALNACNVVLSVGLIFLIAPIVWYTSWSKYMTVVVSDRPQVRQNPKVGRVGTAGDVEAEPLQNRVDFSNGWLTTFLAVTAWLLIVVLNVAALVLAGLGDGGDD